VRQNRRLLSAESEGKKTQYLALAALARWRSHPVGGSRLGGWTSA